MNTAIAAKTFKPGRSGIVVIFLTAFVGMTVLLCTGALYMKEQPAQAAPGGALGPAEQTVPASEALSNGRPSLVLFYPVEVCQRRHCLTTEAIRARLAPGHTQALNLVSVPVYAVPLAVDRTGPTLPLLDWDVYAVEPYIDWLPAFSETVYGWGLEGPVVVLVSMEGDVLYRGDEYFTLDEVAPYIEQLALSN